MKGTFLVNLIMCKMWFKAINRVIEGLVSKFWMASRCRSHCSWTRLAEESGLEELRYLRWQRHLLFTKSFSTLLLKIFHLSFVILWLLIKGREQVISGNNCSPDNSLSIGRVDQHFFNSLKCLFEERIVKKAVRIPLSFELLEAFD